jgi:hypothetical protein
MTEDPTKLSNGSLTAYRLTQIEKRLARIETAHIGIGLASFTIVLYVILKGVGLPTP